MTSFLIRNNVASILLYLILAIGELKSTEAAFSMNETCKYISKGYIGDPSNCQNWGYCREGSLIATGKCNEGFLFDSRQAMCNYANRTTCLSSLENACRAMTQSGYIANPNDCSSYGYCADGVLKGSLFCPEGQLFDPTTVQCSWAKNYKCPTNSICRLVANNVFAGDPNVCGNWIRCVDGAGSSSPCPKQGEKFNPIKGVCVSSYNCGSSVDNPTNLDIPATNADICKTQYSTLSGTGTKYFSDSKTCYGYYACTSADSVGDWGSCPWATHFDPNAQKCVTPYDAKCQYDRCGNLNIKFVAQLGCKGYWNCQNSVRTSEGTCANINSAFPYFDEASGGCVKDIPDEPICK